MPRFGVGIEHNRLLRMQLLQRSRFPPRSKLLRGKELSAHKRQFDAC